MFLLAHAQLSPFCPPPPPPPPPSLKSNAHATPPLARAERQVHTTLASPQSGKSTSTVGARTPPPKSPTSAAEQQEKGRTEEARSNLEDGGSSATSIPRLLAGSPQPVPPSCSPLADVASSSSVIIQSSVVLPGSDRTARSVRSWDNAGEELLALQRSLRLVGSACGFDCHKNAAGAVPSELTCNMSVLRKRVRDARSSMALPRPDGDPVGRINGGNDNLCLPGVSPQRFLHQTAAAACAATLFPINDAVRSFISSNDASAHGAGLQSRMNGSAGASTSGRAVFSSSEPRAATPLSQYLFSQLRQQSLEMDALVRVQCEKLRSGFAETRKRHCRELLGAIEQQTLERLKQKEAELEVANRRKAELEEKLQRAATEVQSWSMVAKNNAAMVSTLSSRLEQALQNAAGNSNATAGSLESEGFGEFDGAHFRADDAQSCCFAGDGGGAAGSDAARRRWSCKACGERDACVILLPCRHLCLCKGCESMVASCPICKVAKNFSLEVFLA